TGAPRSTRRRRYSGSTPPRSAAFSREYQVTLVRLLRLPARSDQRLSMPPRWPPPWLVHTATIAWGPGVTPRCAAIADSAGHGELQACDLRRRREHSKNPNAAGQAVWVNARAWRVAWLPQDGRRVGELFSG